MLTISADVDARLPSRTLPSRSSTANVSAVWPKSELTPVMSMDCPSESRTLELPWLLRDRTPDRTSRSADVRMA